MNDIPLTIIAGSIVLALSACSQLKTTDEKEFTLDLEVRSPECVVILRDSKTRGEATKNTEVEGIPIK